MDLIPEEFRSWAERTCQRYLSQARPTARPVAVLIAGSPWAWSGGLASLAVFRFADGDGPVRISPFECLCLHPDFLSTLQTAPRRIAHRLRPMATKVAIEMLERAISGKCNLVLEVNEAIVSHVAGKSEALQAAGYHVHHLASLGPALSADTVHRLNATTRLGEHEMITLTEAADLGRDKLATVFEQLMAGCRWSSASVHEPSGAIRDWADSDNSDSQARLLGVLKGETKSARSSNTQKALAPQSPVSQPDPAPKPFQKEFTDASGRRVVLRGFGGPRSSTTPESPVPAVTPAKSQGKANPSLPPKLKEPTPKAPKPEAGPRSTEMPAEEPPTEPGMKPPDTRTKPKAANPADGKVEEVDRDALAKRAKLRDDIRRWAAGGQRPDSETTC
ncbi:MAG: zeta toxin family protein [Verrucomicrobiales bacterium]|nr:zeta toxin family protein [Verrucomicrobiales bacterium]